MIKPAEIGHPVKMALNAPLVSAAAILEVLAHASHLGTESPLVQTGPRANLIVSVFPTGAATVQVQPNPACHRAPIQKIIRIGNSA